MSAIIMEPGYRSIIVFSSQWRLIVLSRRVLGGNSRTKLDDGVGEKVKQQYTRSLEARKFG